MHLLEAQEQLRANTFPSITNRLAGFRNHDLILTRSTLYPVDHSWGKTFYHLSTIVFLIFPLKFTPKKVAVINLASFDILFHYYI